MEIEEYIKRFAKFKRVKPEEYEAFRTQILDGLRKMGLETDSIDLDKFKPIAKQQECDKDGRKKDLRKAGEGADGVHAGNDG